MFGIVARLLDGVDDAHLSVLQRSEPVHKVVDMGVVVVIAASAVRRRRRHHRPEQVHLQLQVGRQLRLHTHLTSSITTTTSSSCCHQIHLVVRFHYIYTHHTHRHPFNGPFSGTTRVGRYQKGKTNLDFTEARDSEWQWHQLGHMQVCTSLQTDNHTSTSPLSFFYRPDALPAAQPTASKH